MKSSQTLMAWMARMRADIRLAIVTLYCLCTIGLITPFAIYRLSVGDIVIGVADFGIVSIFIALMLMAWRTQKTQLAADLTACAATGGVMFMVLVLDISHLWTFSTLVGNFMMARKRVAVLASTVLVLSIGLQPTVFALQTERFTFLAVATMVSLFSLIFATRVSHRHGQLSDMLTRDALTGSFNRRALDHDLHAICHKPGQVKDSLVMMDLDNFKRLNDNFGHDSGDQVLIGLARIVELQTREKDRFYRYGGEEFALLLPDTALEGARAATDKLQQALRQELNGPGGTVTVSMGLAERRPGEAPNDWLKRADEALLTAKRTGKDRMVVAD